MEEKRKECVHKDGSTEYYCQDCSIAVCDICKAEHTDYQVELMTCISQRLQHQLILLADLIRDLGLDALMLQEKRAQTQVQCTELEQVINAHETRCHELFQKAKEWLKQLKAALSTVHQSYYEFNERSICVVKEFEARLQLQLTQLTERLSSPASSELLSLTLNPNCLHVPPRDFCRRFILLL